VSSELPLASSSRMPLGGFTQGKPSDVLADLPCLLVDLGSTGSSPTAHGTRLTLRASGTTQSAYVKPRTCGSARRTTRMPEPLTTGHIRMIAIGMHIF
jgi:hypothetical protein